LEHPLFKTKSAVTDLAVTTSVIQLDPETIVILERFLKDGDNLSARLLLKRAASTVNAQAALELGMTLQDLLGAREARCESR
jgi:hypothetical protein